MTDPQVFDPRPCSLGEGPLWHPTREEFFWFDINARKLLSKSREWDFDHFVSAAGWIDTQTILIAGQTSLFAFDLEKGAKQNLCELEPDIPRNRPNDGRADPYGGFWIGTMDVNIAGPTGAIYRFYRGELRKIASDISIPNSICFSPDGLWAYWTDTGKTPIMKQRLSETDGWPLGDAEVFCDPRSGNWNADGSVVDAEGNLWNAQYGGSRVAIYGPNGDLKDSIALPVLNPTCPAFGGENLEQLYVTSAKQGLKSDQMAENPLNGQTLLIDGAGRGQLEHQVVI